MNGLSNILDVIGTDPMTKWVVALFGLRALWSLVAFKRSGLLGRGATAQPAGPATNQPGPRRIRHPLRFVVVMVLGIVLAVVGLFRLAEMGEGAPLAMLMLVLGMYLITTEPVRFAIQFAEKDVVESLSRSADVQSHARSLLRDGHVKLLAIEFGLVTMFVLAIIALNDPIAMVGG